MTSREQAAQARAAGTAAPTDRPRERRQTSEPGPAAVRVQIAQRVQQTREDLDGVVVGGIASTTEDPYEMWDMFGEYTEIVSPGAFGPTLASSPLVEFTLNHGAGGGLPMAHTRNGTLTLTETADGLDYEALVDPTRSDVADLLKALERGDLAEASFKFRITRGVWSPDWSTYRIEQVDLNRGDVSAVNFGANPNASSALRAAVRSMRELIGEDDLAPFAL